MPTTPKANLLNVIYKNNWGHYVHYFNNPISPEITAKYVEDLIEFVTPYLDFKPSFPFNMACLNNYYLTYKNQDNVQCSNDDNQDLNIFTGEVRDKPAEILDISYLDYDLD